MERKQIGIFLKAEVRGNPTYSYSPPTEVAGKSKSKSYEDDHNEDDDA